MKNRIFETWYGINNALKGIPEPYFILKQKLNKTRLTVNP